MSDPFVGEIRLFPYTFPPQGWARCDGQLMPIAQNQQLAAVIGTIYGSSGNSTFNLPNLQGQAPMGAGDGPGLSQRVLSQQGGVESVLLTESNLPPHQHEALANRGAGVSNQPNNNALYGGENDPAFMLYKESPSAKVPMAYQTLQSDGGGNAHENRQPFLPVQFCIALEGVFPPRPS